MGVLLSLAFSMASCQIGQASVQGQEKEVIEINAIYPDFDLHEICQEAATIVHGIVRKKMKLFCIMSRLMTSQVTALIRHIQLR